MSLPAELVESSVNPPPIGIILNDNNLCRADIGIDKKNTNHIIVQKNSFNQYEYHVIEVRDLPCNLRTDRAS